MRVEGLGRVRLSSDGQMQSTEKHLKALKSAFATIHQTNPRYVFGRRNATISVVCLKHALKAISAAKDSLLVLGNS